MPPLVSILIPAYNAKDYLDECLKSALDQTYRRCEIVVVDDGSQDDTYEIALRFMGETCRIVRQENRGQASALNRAMSLANGDYFQFLDADDVLHPRKIAAQVQRLEAEDRNAIAAGAWSRFRHEISEAEFKQEPVWCDLDPAQWLITSWMGGGMMHVAGWLVPRHIAEAAGNWNENLTKAANLDADFFTRALLSASRCLFCPDAKSYYRSGHSSMSLWNTRETQEATLAVLKRTGQALLQHDHSPTARRAYATNLQRFAFAAYPQHIDLVHDAETIAAALGGTDLHLTGGPMLMWLANVFGWKAAKRIQWWAAHVHIPATS